MAVRLPPSNLNPAAQPWARRVELLLEELSNGQAGIRTNHATVTRAVGAVSRAVPSLAAQFATVTSRVAGAPSGLSGVATAYFDSVTGNAEASVVLAWTAPSAYTDGTPMVPLLYELHRLLPGGVWTFVTNVTDPSATLLRQPYGGGAVQYRVRAQGDNGGYSAWSAAATVTMPGTMAAPAAPSAPTLTSKNGMVIATWDGKLGTAATPASVRGVYAEVATDGVTFAQAGQLLQATGGRQAALGPYVKDTVLTVRLRAVDALGQTSGTSSTAAITVIGVAGPDIVANSILTNQIQAGQITSVLIDTTGLTGITVTGGTIQTSATAARGVKLTGTGLQAFNSSGVATFTVDGTTGAVVANTLTATGATISGTITATSGSITGTLEVTGTIRTATTGARVQITSAGIAGYNSAGVQNFTYLSTNGYLSATSAIFTDMQVLGTSSFGGTMTVSGTFQSAPSGARVTVDGSGLHGYNSGGTEVFSFLSTNGSVRATGGTFTNITVTGTSTFGGSLTGVTGTLGSLTVNGNISIGTGGLYTSTSTYPRSRFDTTGLTYDETSSFHLRVGNYLSNGVGLSWLTGAQGSEVFGAMISAETNGDLMVWAGGNGTLYLNGGGSTVASGDFTLTHDASGRQIISYAIRDRSYATASTDGTSNNIVVVTPTGTLGVATGGTIYASKIQGSGGGALSSLGGGTARLHGTTDESGPGFRITTTPVAGIYDGATGVLFYNGATGNKQIYGPPIWGTVATTSTPRAVQVTSTGLLGTTSSSERTKNIAGTVHWNDAEMEQWLGLEVHRFAYKNDPKQKQTLGVIAERVHEAGFGDLVYYDDREDSEHSGRIDGFAYERMAVYEHMALQRLYARLVDLEHEVAALRGA